MAQNLLLIWIDTNIDKSTKDGQNTMSELEVVLNDVNIFKEIDAGIDFLTDVDCMKATLIVEGTVSQQLVQLIHDIPQLDTIYIFCDNQSSHEPWIKQWIKIKGVYTDIRSICEALQLGVKQFNQDSIAMSFVSKDQGVSISNFDKLEPSFMYTQLFKEIFFDIEYSQQFVNDFTNYCRRNNSGPASTIDRFENGYSHQSVIWWYTFPSFIYSMLNCALRTLQVETIITMGFLIRDLHQKIKELYQKQISSYHGKSFIVYRGQGLLKASFEKLLKTKGGLISFNNFLSTSEMSEISRSFAESASENVDAVGVLFIITIDPFISSAPFASIQDDSYFKTEKEILFSMHTVFRIGEIRKDNNIYQVDLQLTADDDRELRTLTEHIRHEIEGDTSWQRLGTLLLRLNQFNEAEQLYTVLLQKTTDQTEKALYYNQLGAAKYHRGDYEKAVEHYEKALEIDQRNLPTNHPSLAISYENIGALYTTIGEFSKALSYYEKALEIKQIVLPENHSSRAGSYSNIGLLYKNMGEYFKALSYYEKALEVWQKTLPANHPDLGISYNNIGEVYMNISKYLEALSYYEKAFDVWQKSLPENHPFLVTCYNNIAEVHRSMDDYLKALSYYGKAFKICQKTLPPNHPLLAACYNNIGTLYMTMGEYSEALSYYKKALEIDQATFLADHPDLATSYNNIGEVYKNMDDYSTALSYYEKALKIDEKTLPVNHPSLATSYNNIGEVYRNMGEYSTALLYNEKAFEIFEKVLPKDHPSLATSYSNIGLVYDNMGEYSKALQYIECSLDIQQRSLPPYHPQLESMKEWIENVKKKM